MQMKSRLMRGIACLLVAHTVTAQTPGDATFSPLLQQTIDPDRLERQARQLLNELTEAERFDFVRGTGFAIRGVPRLGLPSIEFHDAGAGLRIDRRRPLEISQTTSYPATLVLASTWDTELAYAYAQAIGHEFRAAGSAVILGPGLNIHRVSLNGRNLEYMGEDPFLTSRLVEAYVKGAQSTGVAATLKHFVANNHETGRKRVNVIMDDRALREIYMPGFQAGIDAGAWGVMSSYNLLNGEWAGQSHPVITEILRNEMGFKWLVMTDWRAVYNGVKVAQSGTDLEMPEGAELEKNRAELVGTPEIDRMALSILRTGIASGIYEMLSRDTLRKPTLWEKLPEHAELARQVNHEGIVLLKNNGILPLQDATPAHILVTGNNAERRFLTVVGSGRVNGYNPVLYAEEITKRFPDSQVIVTNAPHDELIQQSDLVLVFAGFEREGEGNDRTFLLDDNDLIARSVALNSNTIVTITTGGAVGTDWHNEAAAILQAAMGGQTAAPALADILTGVVNPSGKLPYSFEKNFEHSPAFPVESTGRILVDNIAAYDHPYKEGIYVGYRWYDKKNIEPRYPFGHGLSYTTFSYTDLQVERKGEQVLVHFTITNTGKRLGREIAQVYVSDPKASIERPPKELKSFQKVTLDPGESQPITITLDTRAFSYWCPEARDWVVSKGPFDIHVGASSRNIHLTSTIK